MHGFYVHHDHVLAAHNQFILLCSLSQVEKHLSRYLIEPVQLNVVVKRRLNTEASDLPLIEVVGNLALFKVRKILHSR